MRLEKGYRHWKADLIYERNPLESALERFVDFDKADFIGRQALLEERQRGDLKRFVSLQVDSSIAPAHSGDSLYLGEQIVGTVTSGGYGHRVGKTSPMPLSIPTTATWVLS